MNLSFLTESHEAVRDEILEHLYKKYGIEFEAISLDLGQDAFLIAYPKGGDINTDIVQVQRIKRDGVVEFKDTYFGIIIREEIENEITNILSDIDLPFKVFAASDMFYFNNIFDSTKALSDYRQWEGSHGLQANIVFELEDFTNAEDYANRVFNKLEEAGQIMLINTNFFPSEIYAKISRANLLDIFSESMGPAKQLDKFVSFFKNIGGEN